MNDARPLHETGTLETRIVILEAALAWIRHEARARGADPALAARAMARIEVIASQVLEDDELAVVRMRRHLAREAQARVG